MTNQIKIVEKNKNGCQININIYQTNKQNYLGNTKK